MASAFPPKEKRMNATNVTKATLSIEEAAKALGIGRNQAYEAAHRGDIPIIKIGKRLLVPRVAFERMLSGEAA